MVACSINGIVFSGDCYEYNKEETRMTRTIKTASQGYLSESLDLVEKVFTDSEGIESGKLVRSLVEEIRSKRFYLPELELVMMDEENSVIGYAMFSRFHLEGKYENQLLLLSPVAVKTELQRQHISKDLIDDNFTLRINYDIIIVNAILPQAVFVIKFR